MKVSRIGRLGAGFAIVGVLCSGTVVLTSGTASAAPAPRQHVTSGVHVGTAVAYTRSANGVVRRVR